VNLTAEQTDVLERARQGSDLVVEAFAGTGKTTTIVALAKDRGLRGTYVAYNRAIVDDVRSVLEHEAPQVQARTAHSLAYASVGRRFKHRLSTERISSRQVAKILHLSPLDLTVRGSERTFSPAFLAGCVTEGTRNFANSADPEPDVRHLPAIEGIDEHGEHRNDDAYRTQLFPALCLAWDDLSDESGSLRFSHDAYLKIWQLRGGRVPGEVVFLDEAQDTNPVIAAAITASNGQLVAVGDSYQQIYAWRGALDMLDGLGMRPGTVRGRLTHSFRFGPEIASVANHLLGLLGAPATITGAGAPGTIARAEAPDAILCRTNAGVVSMLLEHLEARPCAIVGGGGQLAGFARGVAELEATGRSTHPELVCFSSLEDLWAYVADDPSGSDLALMVKLCVRYGPETIIDAVARAVPESTPGCLVLSTTHRAKGRQWAAVRLGPDWPQRTLDSPDELRLAYVAVTRARQVLDLSECPILGETIHA